MRFPHLTQGENFTLPVANETYLGSNSLDLGSPGLVTNTSYVSSGTSTFPVNNPPKNSSAILNICAGVAQTPLQMGMGKLSIPNATLYSQPQIRALAAVVIEVIL
ncbi:MAG: hypothetical protein M1533_01935 [Candidatus Thermoplasmatota archaeon]|jgi:hypothetical protein|nr:hypothetical protein [Candidatus Thermoplasmatota archaeon]